MNTKEAFRRGFTDACEGTVYDPTPGQVAQAYPQFDGMQIAAYCNGVGDAVAGETFRMRLCYCTHLNQQWCDCDWCRVVRSMRLPVAYSITAGQAEGKRHAQA